MLSRGISFCKAQGAGNDFILIEDRSCVFPDHRVELIRFLCHRRLGIGADGLILVRKGDGAEADYAMRYFNADGQEASMCGNGLRCFAAFVRALGEERTEIKVSTQNGLSTCWFVGNLIETEFSIPKRMREPCPLSNLSSGFVSSESTESLIHFIDAGVPHAVIFQDEISNIDLTMLGRSIRYHPLLQPEGANVNLVQRIDRSTLFVRTYERGIEGETLACGSGALAAAYVASQLYSMQNITVRTMSGDDLYVHTGHWRLTGPAQLVYQGILSFSEMAKFGLDKFDEVFS